MEGEKTTERPALTKKDFESDQEVRWCPGCGDYAILATVQRTMPSLGVRPENTVFVSGIGCSSRFPYYMNTYGFHGIHGRAPAIATGLKLSRPELSVWVITGDGDGLSIGGNHLIHALRRNVGVKILLFNNQIYGLTKGQYSPTSRIGTKAPSTPDGSIDAPINPVGLAIGAGATFVARVADTDMALLADVLARAHHHRGAAFVEILQNCPVFNDGVWDSISDKKVRPERQLVVQHGAPLLFGKRRELGIRLQGCLTPQVVDVGDGSGKVPLDQVLVHDEKASPAYAMMLALMTGPELPVPVGVIRAEEKPTYEETAATRIREAIAARGRGQIAELLGEGMTWTVAPGGIIPERS